MKRSCVRAISAAVLLSAMAIAPARAAKLPDVRPYCSALGAAGAQVVATCPADSDRSGVVELWKVMATCSAPAIAGGGVATVVAGGTTLASYQFVETPGAQPQLYDYFPPIPAGAPDTSIVFTVPAIAGGGACVACIYCSEQ